MQNLSEVGKFFTIKSDFSQPDMIQQIKDHSHPKATYMNHDHDHLKEHNYNKTQEKYEDERAEEFEDEEENEEENPDQFSDREYRYVCQHCGRGYMRSNHYQKHLMSHTGAKPSPPKQEYGCSFCRKSFTTQAKLNDHTCKLNGDEEMPNDEEIIDEAYIIQNDDFVCQICGKYFSQKYHLQTHMATHTGNKPFNCMICGKAFARKDVLNVHMKVHSDSRDFQCEVCGSRFKQRYHLTRHMNTHLERVDVVCDFCGQVFHRLDRYNQHIKRVHIQKTDEM